MYSVDNQLHTFDLNGTLISKDEGKVSGVAIGRDGNFRDYLVCAGEEELTLTFRKLPSLKSQKLSLRKRPTALAIFENQRMIVLGDETGELTFLWDSRSIKANT